MTGALPRTNPRGKPRLLLTEGLTAPGCLAVRGRSAYVTNCSVCIGTGGVLRVPLR